MATDYDTIKLGRTMKELDKLKADLRKLVEELDEVMEDLPYMVESSVSDHLCAVHFKLKELLNRGE